MNIRHFTIALALFTGMILSMAGLSSCGGEKTGEDTSKVDTAKVKVQDTPPPAPINQALTDAAYLLAGYPVDSSSSLASVMKTPEWKNHNARFSPTWEELESGQFSKVRKWASGCLDTLKGADANIFYPFSGPDFLYINSLFPKGTSYTLTGLEPVGDIPALGSMTPQQLNASFAGLGRSLDDILGYSFFRTNDMKGDFTQNQLKGIVPILMVFLASTKHEIVSVNYVGLAKSGTLKTLTPEDFKKLNVPGSGVMGTEEVAPVKGDSKPAKGGVSPEKAVDEKAVEPKMQVGKKGSKIEVAKPAPAPTYIGGVKIEFRRKGETVTKTLVYFSGDISNFGLEVTPEYLTYVKGLNHPIAYHKAASYLMHKEKFTMIRDLILSECTAVLQDDSGMPVRHFMNEQWKTTFYGAYTTPIALFANLFQADLKKIYTENKDIAPLDFGIGYQFMVGRSNLMLAVKK